MNRAVVDAGALVPAVITGAESWLPATTQREVRSHRSPNNNSAWSELSDTYGAMRLSRRGNYVVVQALRELRPESHKPKPLLYWRHRSLAFSDDQQLSLAQIAELRQLYAKHGVQAKTTDEKERWANLAGMTIVGDSQSERPRRANHRNNLRLYGMHAVNFLMNQGLLDPDCRRDTLLDLKALLISYDEQRLRRDQLENEVEAFASRSPLHRGLLLSLSALRGAYRIASAPITWPTLRLSLAFNQWVDTSSAEVRRGRRLAFKLALGAMAAGAFYLAYKFTHGFGHEHINDIAVAHGPSGSSQNVLPDQTSLPHVPTSVPPPSPPSSSSPTIEFSFQARSISPGEGWISQLSQMRIRYNKDFMDSVGPWLKSRGYAYKMPGGQWGMNFGSGSMDQDTLQQLYQKAKDAGLTY